MLLSSFIGCGPCFDFPDTLYLIGIGSFLRCLHLKGQAVFRLFIYTGIHGQTIGRHFCQSYFYHGHICRDILVLKHSGYGFSIFILYIQIHICLFIMA